VTKEGGVGELTDVPLVSRGREARQMPDMLKRGLGPVENDNEGEYQTTQGIKPPYPRVETDCACLCVSDLARYRLGGWETDLWEKLWIRH
jgi:hypothetical protein